MPSRDHAPSTPAGDDRTAAASPDANRAREHLANECTVLAWLRTGIAIVEFGFAIARFAIAIRQLAGSRAGAFPASAFSVWFGIVAVVAGVALVLAGLLHYRGTRAQLESGTFQRAGYAVDIVAMLRALFGLLLAGYLLYTGMRV